MKSNFTKLFSIFSALILTVVMLQISVLAVGPTLSKTSFSIVKTKSHTLKVTGNSDKVTWFSKNDEIASVSTKGKVTAKSAGTTYIYAKTSGKTLKCKVTVIADSISVDKSSVEIGVGGKAAVKVTVIGTKKISSLTSDGRIAVGKYNNSWDGNSVYMYITGVKVGETSVKVLTESGKYKIIKVKVTTSSAIDETANITLETSDNYAEEVLKYVNIERKKVGLSTLELDETLCDGADIRADEITVNFSHTRPNGSTSFTVFDESYVAKTHLGENIAAGNKSAEATVEQWMNSEGHRANILNPDYKKLGVGYSYSSSERYKHYWVQIFAG